MLASKNAKDSVCSPAQLAFIFLMVSELVPQRATDPMAYHICLLFMVTPTSCWSCKQRCHRESHMRLSRSIKQTSRAFSCRGEQGVCNPLIPPTTPLTPPLLHTARSRLSADARHAKERNSYYIKQMRKRRCRGWILSVRGRVVCYPRADVGISPYGYRGIKACRGGVIPQIRRRFI